MKSYYYLALTFFLFASSLVRAQWEPTAFDQATWVLAQTENGNLIAANDIYPDFGSLYLSQDEGNTWVETSALPYAYTSHLVMGETVIMGGAGTNLAISNDNGETWTNSDFLALFPQVDPMEPIYALEEHNGRIYASLLGHGIVYSEDGGITWSLTDIDSLLDPANPANGGQWCYNLRSFNGKLYSVGIYGIWEYNDTQDLWTQVDDNWYANNTLVVDDVLYIVYNAPGIPNGIRYTTDFQQWEVMPIPNGASTSIRFLEYYEGAFFMGHVQEAILYSLDHGNTWIEYREDFPFHTPVPGLDLYGTPMNLVFSGDMMYCGVYSYTDIGGVYKAPIPEDVLNINDVPESPKFVVYPNPASDYVTIKFPEGYNNSGSIVITDVLGRVKYNEPISDGQGNEITISTESWDSGIYLYNLRTEKSVSSGKLIVE